MLEKARAAFEQVKKLWGALTLVKKVALAVAFVGVVAGVLGVSAASGHETYAVLYSELSPEDASLVTAKLKELKIPYRVEGESTVSVPEDRVHELRIDLAGQGLPRGGGVGFEVFDKQHLGATELEQRVLVRRALEGELSRTISTIAGVQSARVHLVMPEKSLFVERSRDAATASVVVKLRSGRTLQHGEVASIVHLVSSAVPGLSESRVSVVSADGSTLHRPSDGDRNGGDIKGEREQEMSASLESRARELLERTVGRGHADVRISVELDGSSHERTEEHYEPQKSVLRSEQRLEERSTPPSNNASVGNVPGAPSPSATPAASASAVASAQPSLLKPQAAGIPGAQTNLPGGGASPEGQSSTISGPYRQSYTRNFEVDRVTEKTVLTGGKIARLTVAVLVDGKKKDGVMTPREQEEMDKLGELVKSAVGFSAARGDALHIESSTFASLDVEEPATAVEPTRVQKARTYAPVGAVGLVALVLAVMVVRGRGKKKKTADALAPLPPILQLENSTIAADKALTEGDVATMRAEATDIASKDPATAAVVLRAWLHATSPSSAA